MCWMLLLGSGLVQAQPEPAADAAPLLHDQWTVRDGLPVNHANAVYQTPDGYLWLATFDGLVRFDGLRFTIFNAGNTPGLPSSRIAALFPGRDGAFWANTEQGHLVHVAEGRFEADRLLVGQVFRMRADHDGQVWIATNKGLYRAADGRVESAFGGVLDGQDVRDVLRDRRGTLWIAAHDGGLWRADAGGVQRSPMLLASPVTLYEDADGTLWAGGDGLARYNPASSGAEGIWEQVTPSGAPWLHPSWLSSYRAWEFERAPDGGLWLTTTLGTYRLVTAADDGSPARLIPVTRRERILTQVFHRRSFARCAEGEAWLAQEEEIYRGTRLVASVGSAVTDLLCDQEGNLWATTRSAGLHRFRHPPLRSVGDEQSLGFRNVYTLYEDRSGGLWFTDYGGAVGRLYGGVFEKSGVPFEHLGVTAGHTAYEDRDGNLWLGFQVCRAADRRADGGCPRFQWAQGAPRFTGVYALLQTRDGALWFGTRKGLYRLLDGQWMAFTPQNGLPDEHLRYLLESRNGDLYMATLRSGVVRLPQADPTRPFTSLTTRDGLSSDHVRALYEDVEGVLWIGTEDRGLGRYDAATGSHKAIRQSDGLYYDGIHQIVEDGFGRLWMSTNQGLFWVLRADLNAFARGEVARVHSTVYTERDGMRNREANGGFQQSALRASDGSLWFATQDGAVVVEPAAIGGHLPPPRVIIEGVTAGDEGVPVRSDAPVTLGAGQRSFRIAYTSPSFTAPERIRYQYRLDGFDKGWVEAEHRREAVYTRVPPGPYRFYVRASNDGAAWNRPTVLRLHAAPAFFETWWFFALCGLAAVGLLGGVYRLRTRHLRHRHQELEARVHERTEALRAAKEQTDRQAERLLEMDRLKSRFFTNVSHEFRTPLTLTIGPLEDLKAEEADALSASARARVDLALRNSKRLLRLIGQLLDIAKLEAGEMQLRTAQQDLGVFLQGVALSFAPLAERRRVRFEVAAPERPVAVYFDAEKMEHVLVNLLSNAFKFTPKGGAILLALQVHEGTGHGTAEAHITVRDSGPGISADALPRLFERFYQFDEAHAEVQTGSGIGLSLAKELTELHGGRLAVESTLGFGAAFTVALPLGRAHLSDEQVMPAEGARPVPLTYLPDDAPAGVHAAPEEGEHSDDDQTTVLIADDNADIRTYVRRHLETRYRVLEATDGQDALDQSRTALPDVIVSDVMMPRLDGFALVRALRENPQTSFIPIILLTARATDDEKVEGLQQGADDYLVKPFNVRELHARIDNLLASRQSLKKHLASLPVPSTPLSAVPAGSAPSDLAFLRRVRAAVDTHLGDDTFTVEQLAEAVAQSRSNLHRRLKLLLDQSPTAFIRHVRIERATVLLREQQGAISEVAYAVGFKSVSHFSHAFRNVHGIPPSLYLERESATRLAEGDYGG